MEKVTARKTRILDVLDGEIKELETKLAKAQPMIDELAQLRRTRATLLSERSVTGGVRAGTKITMEQVIHEMTEADAPIAATDLAVELGVDASVVRSHLNRYRDERYRKEGDNWVLIGALKEDEEEDEDDE